MSDENKGNEEFNQTEKEILFEVEENSFKYVLKDEIQEAIELLLTIPTPQDALNLLQKTGLPLPEPIKTVFEKTYNQANRSSKISNIVKRSPLRQIYPVILALVELGYPDQEAINLTLDTYAIDHESDSALRQFRRDCKAQHILLHQLSLDEPDETVLENIWNQLDST